MCGNHHGNRRFDHFISELRAVIGVIMDFEKTLVVIPYPDGPDSYKAWPFSHDPSTLASYWKAKPYASQDLYIADGKPTSVKIFVGHDSSAAVFNSLELAKLLDDREASIRVCHVQSSKVVVAGYFQGSTKTCLLYTSPSPRDRFLSRMPSSA